MELEHVQMKIYVKEMQRKGLRKTETQLFSDFKNPPAGTQGCRISPR